MLQKFLPVNKIDAMWLAALMAALPWTLAYWQDLWRWEHFRFFPFALGITSWLVYSRWDGRSRLPGDWFSWFAVAAGVLFLCLGTYASSPWLGAVGGASLLCAFCRTHWDRDSDQRLTTAALPMLLTLRLPIGYDQILTLKLQEITTTLSSVLLDLFGISHSAANNTIQLAHRELFIAEACSGIQSVFTLMFLSVTLAAIYRRSLFSVPMYLLVAIAMAVVANVFRVSSIVAVDSWLEIDLATGWQHELIGYLALGLGVVGLVSFDRLVVAFGHPIDHQVEQANPLVSAWYFLFNRPGSKSPVANDVSTANDGFTHSNRLLATYCAIGICGLLAFFSTAQAFRLRLANGPAEYAGDGVYSMFGSARRLFQPSSDMLDQHLASLEVVDFQSSSQENNPRLGAHSDIWTARMRDGESTQIQIVLSQPYTRWHELCVCYEVADWLLLNRVSIGREGGYPPLEVADNGIARAPAGNGTDGRFVLARLKRAGGQRGYVFYSAIDTTGRVIEPPPMIGGVGGRLDALFGSDPSGNDSGSTEVMMLQMFAIAPSKIGLQQINAIKRDFVKVRAKIASEFVAAQN